MSDALPFPPRPNPEQYRKLAKDFLKAVHSGSPDQVHAWAGRWAETLARLGGASDAPEGIAGHLQLILKQLGRLIEGRDPSRLALADAQFFIARFHGFESWPKFSRHLEALRAANSEQARFEAAVDAIVGGDRATLARLLKEDPRLVRARSTREHGSALLHYVSANGVEGYRQKTPANIVEIARLLLDAGADVNAESEAYGGGSTALGLTATSYHPEAAGVQIPLLQLLLDRGARIEPVGRQGAIRACLANGRGPAAEFLAAHGAKVGLEEAAGVGRLDIVERFFEPDGTLRPTATADELRDGFAWACEYGRTAVAAFLLRTGAVKPDEKLRMNHGQTGLHWAAYGGHADTVAMLLERGAPVHARDDSYDNTPLEWALYAWGNSETPQRDGYYKVVRMLVNSGATLDPERWVGEDPERRRSIRRIASDPGMREALAHGLPEERDKMP